MKLLYNYLKKHRRLLAIGISLAVINQFFSLLDPQLYRLIVDNYATRVGEISTADFFRGTSLLLLGIVVVAFISRVAKSFQDYYVSLITQKIGAGMYQDAVRHAFSLPYLAFEDQRSGELLQKLQKARTDVQLFIQGAVSYILMPAISIILVVAYALYVHWSIGVAFVLLVPALAFTASSIGRKIKAAQTSIVKEMSQLAGSTTETLRNVELVKSLGLEKQETRRLNDTTEEILKLELRKVKLVRRFMFLQGTTINAMRAIIIFLNLWLMWAGVMTIGQFFIIMLYSFFVFGPLSFLGEVLSQYQEARASLEVLEDVLAQEPERAPAEAVKIPELEKIEFKEVSFNYPAGDVPAVQGVSLSVQRGKSIALVGPSGSGKTTLIKLLVNLYKPTAGQVLINNQPAAGIDFNDFRRRIGYVSQETQLFAGTVRDNLAFVRAEASDADCLAAIKAAAAEGIIARGGQGLDTRIGEGGLKLSGGERQRIAIARALLREPQLLIFDEATSALDSLTEKEISDTIQRIKKERPQLATVMVAHRLSTVAHADTIYVLEKGRLSEAGSHHELLNRAQGLYAALWRSQQAA